MKVCHFLTNLIIKSVLFAITRFLLSDVEPLLANALEIANVRCFQEFMHAEVLVGKDDCLTLPTPKISSIYWQNIRSHGDPLKKCQPLFDSKGFFVFKIAFKDLHKCGFTRLVNKLTSYVTFHQNLIAVVNHQNLTYPIKCSYESKIDKQTQKHKIMKRDLLPDDFREDDDLEILETIEETAPDPQIAMEVRQNGQLIDGMVTVIPGTPLIMEIKLNGLASKVYGINVNYLEVSDARDTSETIVFRGCTVDPYLFENFLMTPNKTLQAKFRAFKFPNTAFVQFRANVQICLKKCLISHCLQGQGRSKRELSKHNKDLYEISLGLLMRVDASSKQNKEIIDETRRIEKHVKQLRATNVILRKLY